MATLSEIQSALAGGIGQGLDPAMEHIGTPVEHDLGDAGSLGTLGDQLADRAGGGDIRAGLDPRLHVAVERRCRGERHARLVVDDLGINMPRRAEHRKAQPPATGLPQLVALAVAPAAKEFVCLLGHGYFFLPSLRRTVSSLYLIPLPL